MRYRLPVLIVLFLAALLSFPLSGKAAFSDAKVYCFEWQCEITGLDAVDEDRALEAQVRWTASNGSESQICTTCGRTFTVTDDAVKQEGSNVSVFIPYDTNGDGVADGTVEPSQIVDQNGSTTGMSTDDSTGGEDDSTGGEDDSTGGESRGIKIKNWLGSDTFADIAKSIAGFLYTVGLIFAVLMILWAAFLFITSAGNEDRVTQARKAILWAVIGLVILLLAGGITTLLSSILGVDKPE